MGLGKSSLSKAVLSTDNFEEWEGGVSLERDCCFRCRNDCAKLSSLPDALLAAEGTKTRQLQDLVAKGPLLSTAEGFCEVDVNPVPEEVGKAVVLCSVYP